MDRAKGERLTGLGGSVRLCTPPGSDDWDAFRVCGAELEFGSCVCKGLGESATTAVVDDEGVTETVVKTGEPRCGFLLGGAGGGFGGVGHAFRFLDAASSFARSSASSVVDVFGGAVGAGGATGTFSGFAGLGGLSASVCVDELVETSVRASASRIPGEAIG